MFKEFLYNIWPSYTQFCKKINIPLMLFPMFLMLFLLFIELRFKKVFHNRSLDQKITLIVILFNVINVLILLMLEILGVMEFT